VRGDGAVCGHAGPAPGLEVGEELGGDGVESGDEGPRAAAEEGRGVDEVVEGRARRAPRAEEGPVVERHQPARLGGVDAAGQRRPRLHELERAHAVQHRVVDAGAQHHAATLEESQLQARIVQINNGFY